jgi:hypothetical protein
MAIEHRKIDDQEEKVKTSSVFVCEVRTCGIIAVVQTSYQDFTMVNPADLLPCID